MPAKATDTIQFVSGGDCGVNAHAVANNIQAARQDPMFAVIGGDLAYDNGTSVETFLAFLRNYSKHMIGRDGRLIPMVACIGNHEVDGGYDKPRANRLRSSTPCSTACFPNTGYATLDFGDYLSLVLLDTGHTTPIGGEQTDWLESTLKARADHPHVMVVNHVPAYPSFRNPISLPGADGKRPITAPATGTASFGCRCSRSIACPSSWSITTTRSSEPSRCSMAWPDQNGVLYLGDGSWGKIRSPKNPEQLHYLAAASHDYHLSLHRLQGNERFHVALDENGRIMDTCHSGQRTTGLIAMPVAHG